jgi:hypothetical protein
VTFALFSAGLFSGLVLVGTFAVVWELAAPFHGRDDLTLVGLVRGRPELLVFVACALSLMAGGVAGHLATIVER